MLSSKRPRHSDTEPHECVNKRSLFEKRGGRTLLGYKSVQCASSRWFRLLLPSLVGSSSVASSYQDGSCSGSSTPDAGSGLSASPSAWELGGCEGDSGSGGVGESEGPSGSDEGSIALSLPFGLGSSGSDDDPEDPGLDSIAPPLPLGLPGSDGCIGDSMSVGPASMAFSVPVCLGHPAISSDSSNNPRMGSIAFSLLLGGGGAL